MNKYIIAILAIIFLGSCKQEEETSLVKKISNTPNAELVSMTFFELNILKNSVFSLQGYKYADDRKWLYSYFYTNKDTTKTNEKWDLNLKYPEPESVEFKFDDDMKKAVANVRIAMFNKIRSIGDINQIDELIDKEYNKHNGYIFGRKIKYESEFKESIRREVHGYNRIITIIDTRSSFDASELMGVYIGSLVLLKQVIEAQNGKVQGGILGWEISQLTEITPSSNEYNVTKLPTAEKEKIMTINKVIEMVKNSGIGDIPDELKNKKIEMNEEELPDEYYDPENYAESAYGAAC